MIANTITFIVVIGILVFSHELGHFLAARICGVGVEKFSLGFGPKLFGFRVGITDYCISAIPLGGYVRMVGDDNGSIVDNNLIHLSFSEKNVLKKIIVVISGPIFNLFLAIIIFFIVFSSSGVFFLKPIIGDVVENLPASSAGIKSGDTIVSINGNVVNNWDDLIFLVYESQGEKIKVVYNRSNFVNITEITPSLVSSKNIFGQKKNKYIIGVTPSGEINSKKVGYIEAFYKSLNKTYEITYLTIFSIVKLLQGSVSAKTMGGPIMIAEMATNNAKEGFVYLMFFIGLLSVNLAVLNFLPIPILDGGHLVFFILEAFIGKPINDRIKDIAHQIGGLILLFLMIYVFYNDILRIISD